MAHHVGTSGWSYPGWRERFYPHDVPQAAWLEFYARHFQTVEINMTFYRFPKPGTLKDWLDRTPPGFLFSLKANRRITHQKKIKDVRAEVRYFYILAGSLGDRLGCVLFQLPPSIMRDLPLLEGFLSSLSPDFRNVIEFRHESWFDDGVFDLLRSRKIIFCIASSDRLPRLVVETADVSYVRFHGLMGGHSYRYSEDELRQWSADIRGLGSKDGFIYFNNDYQAHAVANGLRLAELLREG